MTIVTPYGQVYGVKPEAPKYDPLTDSAPIRAKYRVPAGKILVARDRVQDSWDKDGLIAATDDRKRMMQMYEQWATVLMVGPSYKTDYGTTIEAPDVKEGQRVLIGTAGGEDVELSAGDARMTLTLIGFRGVVLIEEMGSE